MASYYWIYLVINSLIISWCDNKKPSIIGPIIYRLQLCDLWFPTNTEATTHIIFSVVKLTVVCLMELGVVAIYAIQCFHSRDLFYCNQDHIQATVTGTVILVFGGFFLKISSPTNSLAMHVHRWELLKVIPSQITLW